MRGTAAGGRSAARVAAPVLTTFAGVLAVVATHQHRLAPARDPGALGATLTPRGLALTPPLTPRGLALAPPLAPHDLRPASPLTPHDLGPASPLATRGLALAAPLTPARLTLGARLPSPVAPLATSL
ncbi:MAG: hypothetical protein AAFV86_07490, partial [Pseudomonadota bacterium]